MKFIRPVFFQRIFCLTVLVLGLLFKFWLISETEILDDPNDSSEYVLQILYPENGGPGYGPGTGDVGRFFYDMGLPFRIGLELAYMGACALVIRALFDWPGRTYAATGLMLVALFDPCIMELFAELLSDQLWMIETMVGVALLCVAVGKEGWMRSGCLLVASLAFGLSTITRSVVAPLTASLLFWTLLMLAVLFFSRAVHGRWRQMGLLLLCSWSVLLGIGVIYLGTSVYHAKKYGYYGISAGDSWEYKKFYLCLQSVGDPTGDPYFPVDAERRKIIAQAGPTAKWMMLRLDNDQEDNYGGVLQYGRYGIPAGNYHFAVFHVTLAACQDDFRKVFVIFNTIEDEIADASRRGVIKTRPIAPLPDARLNLVWSVYPHELGITFRSITHEPSGTTAFLNQDKALFQNANFSTALHRRSVEDSPIQTRIWSFLCLIYGWLYSPLLFVFFLVTLAVVPPVLVWKWPLIREEPLTFLVQQLFVVLFFAMISWYSFFGASGVRQDTRYMIFNHVLLPMLLVYYLALIVRLLRKDAA